MCIKFEYNRLLYHRLMASERGMFFEPPCIRVNFPNIDSPKLMQTTKNHHQDRERRRRIANSATCAANATVGSSGSHVAMSAESRRCSHNKLHEQTACNKRISFASACRNKIMIIRTLEVSVTQITPSVVPTLFDVTSLPVLGMMWPFQQWQASRTKNYFKR